MEHLKDDEKALRMMHSWLKPDGKLIVSVPTFKFSEKYKALGHLRHYTDYGKFEQLLKFCGFKVLKKKRWGSIIRYLIFSKQDNSNNSQRNFDLLRKIIKPFIYVDTRMNLFKNGIIVECRKKDVKANE